MDLLSAANTNVLSTDDADDDGLNQQEKDEQDDTEAESTLSEGTGVYCRDVYLLSLALTR